MFHIMSEKSKFFELTSEFSVRCIPTGSPSGSVMLLINIKSKNILSKMLQPFVYN